MASPPEELAGLQATLDGSPGRALIRRGSKLFWREHSPETSAPADADAESAEAGDRSPLGDEQAAGERV